MATLNFPGLATGIDTTEIIKQLMNVYSRRLALYKLQKSSLEQRQSAIQDVRTKVSALQMAASDLADYRRLQVFKTITSDSGRLTVIANDQANPGSHSVIIQQLATTDSWIQDDSSFQHKTDYVGAGTFIYSYNYKERVITTTATTTLEDLVGLINNDEKNPGVTASLLYQGGRYRLMLTGRHTGQDYQISINDSTTQVLKASTTFTEDGDPASLQTKLIDLDQWSGQWTGDETITITGKDHYGNPILPAGALSISRDTTLAHLLDQINYYFDGLAVATLENGQIVLTDAMNGTSQLVLTLQYNANGSSASLELPSMAVSTTGGATTATITSLAPSKFVQTQRPQNAKIMIDGYSPGQTAEVQSITLDAAATAGTFTLSFKGQTTDPIAYDATATQIQEALNNLESIQQVGPVEVSGSLNEGLTITFSNTAGDVARVSIDISGLTGPSEATLAETTKGTEQWLSRNSNAISDALTGITLNLQDTSDTDASGNPIPIKITISHDTSAIASKVDKLVSAYNALLATLKEKTAYNDTTKQMGPLSDELGIVLIKSQMQSPFVGAVPGFSSNDAYDEAEDIGLSLDGAGQLQFDRKEFEDALKDHFQEVILLLGAVGRGVSNSSTIDFYSASDRYTEAGEYEVQVTIQEQGGSNVITSAQIRKLGESSWRAMNIDGNLISGDDSLAPITNKPLYPEKGLYLQVDLSTTGTFTARVRVKKGMVTNLEELLEATTKPRGTLDVSNQGLQDRITRMDRTISNEQTRLDRLEERLKQRFARLEKALIQWQQQMQSVGVAVSSFYSSMS
ncbi:MAG: flagellar filament capping protein FliD [Sedimentisphaerales bacterium]|nr:flagellar filament capping protein FliD [Sedimentisphaerales bacterium]